MLAESTNIILYMRANTFGMYWILHVQRKADKGEAIQRK